MLATSPRESGIVVLQERVDDIPVLFALAVRLRLPELLEQHLRTHGNQKGLRNGWLCTVWIVYILSQGDHRKSPVEEWARRHYECLRTLLGQDFSPKDFNDDRLGVVLERLSRPAVWEPLERALWEGSVTLYQLEVEAVRLDSTSSYGYHSEQSGELMRRGHSKDHRPDLPQLKLMAAGAQPSAQLIACDVHPGNAADDPLYRPLIERVRKFFGTRSMLYIGDAKMAALATRADIARHGDTYLVPLPLTGKTAKDLSRWVDAVVLGQQNVELVWNGSELIGAGYELNTKRSTILDGRKIGFNERLLVVRSIALAASKANALEDRLYKAIEELLGLTPPPARGRQQIREEAALEEAIGAVLKRHKVDGLLKVSWERHSSEQERLVGPGRPGAGREVRKELTVRYQIKSVERDEQAISLAKWRLGWRVYATNAKRKSLSLTQAVLQYRAGWCLERDFHLVKDLPLGLSPLFVRKDEQIRGMTFLLTLGLRLLTLMELEVRERLSAEGEKLAGLYEGNPARKTDKPTATRLLKAIAGAEISLIRIDFHGEQVSHLTPLTQPVRRILELLRLDSAYDPLLKNSS
jgi:transposase